MTVWFVVSGCGVTVSLHPMKISRSRATKKATLVIVHAWITPVILKTFWIFTKSSLVDTSFARSTKVLFSLCIVIPATPIFYTIEHKAKCNLQLCCTFNFLGDCVWFLAQYLCIQYYHCKCEDSVFPILDLRVHRKKPACSHLFHWTRGVHIFHQM